MAKQFEYVPVVHAYDDILDEPEERETLEVTDAVVVTGEAEKWLRLLPAMPVTVVMVVIMWRGQRVSHSSALTGNGAGALYVSNTRGTIRSLGHRVVVRPRLKLTPLAASV